MIIKIDTIPARGLRVELEEKADGFKDSFRESGYKLSGPVRALLVLTVSKGSLYIEGSVSAPFKARCDRCLEEFSFKIDAPVSLYFTRLTGLKHEVELKAPDMDISVLHGDEIDTHDILLGQLALEIPLSALCRVDCRGLCPGCGLDLNKEPCGCEAGSKVDARLAALKNYKVK
ncbi:MAG: DUF177 domain-containing protein [Thermodesulfobacteriota bacterium]